MSDFSQAFLKLIQGMLPSAIGIAELIAILIVFSLLLLAGIIMLLLQQKSERRRFEDQAEALKLREQQLTRSQEENNDLTIRNIKLLTLLQTDRRHHDDKLRLLEEAREELRLQFSDLAQRIFDEKSARFSELNREKLDAILTPFHNQLGELKQEINEIYRNDTRERLSLKHEIVQLRDLNSQLNEEAINLTRALKGDTKVQGNWGELVLEKVLERSGLHRGREYETQGGFRDPQNRLRKPDVIIHLPDGKDIIVDSKVSLISWERYANSDSEEERESHRLALIKAVRDHITSLGAKNYPSLRGLRSLDFVVMFMPIEAAFHLAVSSDETLLNEALSSNIVVVTPTTLLATLRTIENIWQFEYQDRNGQEIARRAGIIYDKFRGFVEELDKLGRQLAGCQASYESALQKLSHGRGNLISLAEGLRSLGVQVKKDLPKSITESAEIDSLPADAPAPSHQSDLSDLSGSSESGTMYSFTKHSGPAVHGHPEDRNTAVS